MSDQTVSLNAISPEDQALLDKQIASWRKEIARLQDLVNHAIGASSSSTLINCRSAFEKWCGDTTFSRKENGEYEIRAMENRWKIWKAAWEEKS